jgi:hypothetical protein
LGDLANKANADKMAQMKLDEGREKMEKACERQNGWLVMLGRHKR